MGRWLSEKQRLERDKKVTEMRFQDYSVPQIAGYFSTYRSTIWNILIRLKKVKTK